MLKFLILVIILEYDSVIFHSQGIYSVVAIEQLFEKLAEYCKVQKFVFSSRLPYLYAQFLCYSSSNSFNEFLIYIIGWFIKIFLKCLYENMVNLLNIFMAHFCPPFMPNLFVFVLKLLVYAQLFLSCHLFMSKNIALKVFVYVFYQCIELSICND